MANMNIPKRVSTALLNSLGSGVVSRVGLEYIAVGRKDEVAALLKDLENISEGGAGFRFITGRYGSGKSFLLQLIRNYAMERNFVVADADLSPERRLTGANGQGLATYRELMNNFATKTRPDGGALTSILERWISTIQTTIAKETGLRPDNPEFCDAIESRIMETVNNMEGMVHGFDFATVLSSYWKGYRLGDDNLKNASIKWLRGEYTNKTDAKTDLKVKVIIDDSSWYDYLKIMTKFVSKIGYKGLIVIIDETVNLYKVSHTQSRQNNYEKILTMFNDTMQGKAQNIGILMGITPQALEDPRRGLYSYEALKSRLSESRFISDDCQNLLTPTIKLKVLTPEEIFVLLDKLAGIHSTHYGYERVVNAENLQGFLQEIANKLGAQELLTPRETIRDFISILNILYQNPNKNFNDFIKSSEFVPSKEHEVLEDTVSPELAEFSL